MKFSYREKESLVTGKTVATFGSADCPEGDEEVSRGLATFVSSSVGNFKGTPICKNSPSCTLQTYSFYCTYVMTQ